jgi:5-deoxy-glucuronate isomerase
VSNSLACGGTHVERQVLVRSDWNARVYLEGVGDAERRLEVTPAIAGWDTLSFRSYTFRAGQVIDGESATDEMTMVLLSGAVTIEIGGPGGKQTWECHGRASVFDGAPYAIYLPPGHVYTTTVHTDADCVYGRAPAEGRLPPRLIRPEELRTDVDAAGNQRTVIFFPNVTEHLQCAETILRPAQWSSGAGDGAQGVEQVSYFRADPETGWGMQRIQGRDGSAAGVLVRHGDAVIVRHAPSEVVSSPETTLYALTYLANH